MATRKKSPAKKKAAKKKSPAKKRGPQKRTAGKGRSGRSASKRTAAKKSAPGKKSAPKKRSSGTSGSENGAPNSQLLKLFTDALKDLYWAEKALTKALPKMQKNATTDELKTAIEQHVVQTEDQISRLEDVFELLGEKARAKKCEAMEGLIKEGETVMEETEPGSMTRDAGIIMAAQKVEHYEISSYGTLVQIAGVLGLKEAAEILEQTLEEEKLTDETLTNIAEDGINWQAEQEEAEEEEEEEEAEA